MFWTPFTYVIVIGYKYDMLNRQTERLNFYSYPEIVLKIRIRFQTPTLSKVFISTALLSVKHPQL